MKASAIRILVLGIVVGCGGATSAPASPASPGGSPGDPLGAALAGPARSADSRARDTFRHPRETLAFFGLREDMTVVELWPGGGWYTEILAPYLAPKGKLIVTGSKVVAERIEKEPAIFGKVTLRKLDLPNDFTLGPDGSVDLALTFRNVHNWMNAGYADKVFASAFRALKHGGVLGVVEHRAKPGTDAKASAETGYVTEDVVVGFAKLAGFALDARSELNANPKDTTNHPGGVWALPPTLANGDKDRDAFVGIGESDRMTLRFKKP